MKLLIAIPTMDYIHVEFVKSLEKLVERLKDDNVDFSVEFGTGALVYLTREDLVTKAIDGKFTHVLWLDSDMVFNEGLVADLIGTERPFVTAICHSRRPPFRSCVFKHLLPTAEKYTPDEYPKNVFEIAGCGFACLMIETRILEAVRKKCGTCFMPTLAFGEDLEFCHRATDMGYRIWCEPGIKVGHIGHRVIYRDDYGKTE